MSSSDKLGTDNIRQLLIKQSVPAATGFLILSLYTIVDTFFVGRWVEGPGIAAITVIMPISFGILSIGMAIGIGGGSLISQALGAEDQEKAEKVLGNQIVLILVLGTLFFVLGNVYKDFIIDIFGGKGDIFPLASQYFVILMFGVPFLMLGMMVNNVVRAQGKPKMAMLIMIVPSIINTILDPILIIYYDMGIEGAAWATTISYWVTGSVAILFLISNRNEIHVSLKCLKFDFPIIKGIMSVGGVSIARQGASSLLILVLNQTLYILNGENGVETYGIVGRLVMFAIFPIIGIMQGFMPIAGYNYGAIQYDRVKEVLWKACQYGFVISSLILTIIFFSSETLVRVFTNNPVLIHDTPYAMKMVFLLLPLVSLQMIGAAYFQAIGKAMPALVLTLTRQLLFLIPLILILSNYWGIEGLWYAFPISDLLSTALTMFVLYFSVRKLKQ